MIAFADLAIEGLGFASPVLGSIGTPLTVQQTQLAGRTTPTDTYAAAIAVVFSLMFVTVLLAASMLALERSENAYSRLVRGLVTPGRLLWGKVVLAGGCAAAVALVMSLLLGLFVHLELGPAAAVDRGARSSAAGAFGALGVAVGALAREVSVASLLGFAVALPVAFVALVPANAVSGALKGGARRHVVRVPVPRGARAGCRTRSAAPGPGSGCRCCTSRCWPACSGRSARVALRRFASR